MNVHRSVFISSMAIFSIVSMVLYWYAPSVTAHFEGDSIRYYFIAQHITLLKEIPLEVLGYPVFLSLIYHLISHSMVYIILFQVLLSIGCLLLLRRIMWFFVGIEGETIVTILWLLNLGFLIYSQLLLIEVILAFFYLWFIERILTFYYKPSYRFIIEAGFILGFSILLRPASLFYACCFAPFLLFIQKKSFFYRFIACLLFLGSFYVPIGFYMTINYWLFNQFIICPVMNVNLFHFFYPKLIAALKEQEIFNHPFMLLINKDITQQHITIDTQRNLFRLMMTYPFISIKIWLINMLKSAIGLYQTQWKLYFELADQATSYFTLPGNWFVRMKLYICSGTIALWLQGLGWYELIYLIVEYVSAGIGSLWLLAQRKIWLFFFAISFVLYGLLITGPDGSGRFRMMIEPWLLVLTALGLTLLIVKNKKKVF